MLKNSCEMFIEQFKLYYPLCYEKAIDWWKSGPYHITFLLNDNTRVEFDASENTLRGYPKVDRSVNSLELRKEIGRNIRKYITYKGLTQGEVSELVGVTPALLSRYVNGTTMPGYDKLHNLAHVLDCRVADLTGEYND